MSAAAGAALLLPHSRLRSIWRLNPQAHASLLELGTWAIALMGAVSVACVAAALGLWFRAEWGRRTALALLAANLIGDVANAVFRRDLRTLIGLPIAAGLIAYLSSARGKAYCGREGRAQID